MSAQNSFQSISEQLVNFNTNVVEILSKLNSLTTSPESSVSINITDSSGIQRTINLPSFSYLSSEITRLSNNINAIYGLDGAGSLVQPSNNSSFRKVVTVDLNKEPVDISSLSPVTRFSTAKNWFFDGLLNPQLFVNFDLSGKVDDTTSRCLVRRYIISFEKISSSTLSTNGQLALSSFNGLFLGRTDISQSSLLEWISTTPGVSNPLDPQYDEQIFELDPNFLLYIGTFTVVRTQEDPIQKKLWYLLNTLEYVNSQTLENLQLKVGDELLVNLANSNTKYKIIEISTSESNPKIRLERTQGFDPVPIGFDSLKIFSPVLFTKNLRVSIGYDERCVVFVKAISGTNTIQSKNWSLGTAFYTNELVLQTEDSQNGTPFEVFYTNTVSDYGRVLTDLVSKKIPNSLSSATPAPPELVTSNFKVVQINTHLTDQINTNLLKDKYSQNRSLQSEIDQLNKAINEKTTQSQTLRFTSASEREQFQNEIDRLISSKDSKTRLFRSNADEITSITNTLRKKDSAKFRIRGFWPIPQPVITRGTTPQEVVQFRVQYRYLSVDGTESPVTLFRLSSSSTGTGNVRGVFSNWNEYKTDVRKRVYNQVTGTYTWQIEDVSQSDTPNINQIDIPIQPTERVEFRIKSISEVGWPESPVESGWSNILSVTFPDDLSTIVGESDFILSESSREELRVSITDEFSSRGVDSHLSDSVISVDKTYLHKSQSILSGFRDENGIALDLYSYLQTLENKIQSLEALLGRTRSQISISIFRNNEEFTLTNGSEISFNIELEDYLSRYSGTDNVESGEVPTGRVYSNSIYSIKDFILQVRNISSDSPLGLLSSRNYSSGETYDNRVPQVFWVNDQDELIVSNTKGVTNTQLDNQFIWSVNYSSLTQTEQASKLSDNIGNNFVSSGNNSLTPVLSSNEFNLGYLETSVLNFQGNNLSLLDPKKWIDIDETFSSETKLLTTIHPAISRIQDITEVNTQKSKELSKSRGDSVNINIPIYFKMNALDNVTKRGQNYEWIDLNNSTTTVKHTKKVRFFLETDQDSRPFVFTLLFNLNRNKVILTNNTSF